MKVIGNSGYGSLIVDKTKHHEIKYVQGEHKTCLKVNDPLFQKLECLDVGEQHYEMEIYSHNKDISSYNIPSSVGYSFILCLRI